MTYKSKQWEAVKIVLLYINFFDIWPSTAIAAPKPLALMHTATKLHHPGS